MLSNYGPKECIICDQTITGSKPQFNGIIFTNLEGEPFICERCFFWGLTIILGRTVPKSKFEKYMDWKPEIGLKKTQYTVVQKELGL